MIFTNNKGLALFKTEKQKIFVKKSEVFVVFCHIYVGLGKKPLKQEMIQMKISSIKFKNSKTTTGLSFDNQFANEVNELGNIVILTGGNGSGKSRFLKLLKNEFDVKKNNLPTAETEIKIDDCGIKELTSELAQKINIINYSHFDARLHSADKFSPYVIHQAKEKLQNCNYEETALNSLLYLRDLSQGYSDTSNETNDYRELKEFIDFAKELELEFTWEPNEKCLKVFDRVLDEASLSPGQLYALRIAVACKAHKTGNDYVFFLDEPETHLHPSLLIKIINNLMKHFSNAQFWISTHSLELISYLNTTRNDVTTLYMENGVVAGRLRSNTEPILSTLIGIEDNQFAVKQLFSSPEELACNKFCAECFLRPTVISKSQKEDPSSGIVEKDISSVDCTGKLNILDFGAGDARLLLCMYEDDFKSGYIYNAYNVEKEHFNSCKNTIEALEVEGKSFLGKDSLEELFGCVDRVYMVNVLHEISPEDWQTEFNTINQLLSEKGQLIIIERETLTFGESPFVAGYLMLTGSNEETSYAANNLFGSNNVEFRRHGTKKHIISYTVTKEGLEYSQKADLRVVYSALKQDALSQIKQLKEIESQSTTPIDKYKLGLQLAFWLNQLSCATILHDEINEEEN